MSPDEVDALETRLLLEGIYRRFGYDLRDYVPESVRRRVAAVLGRTELPHLGELQHRVLTDPAFFASVLEGLTVQVSEMFRDPEMFLALRAHVVPVLRTYPLLKVWHAGCATGEEAYSSAILLHEEGLLERTQIHATDLSPNALTQARHGTYPAEKLDVFAANHQASGGSGDFSRWYTQAYGGIAMRDTLRKHVHFFQHDLVADHVFGEMHVVFCRNVLIYFGHELRTKVLAKLTASLCPGGYLCLGSSERLPLELGDERFSEVAPNTRIYRRER